MDQHWLGYFFGVVGGILIGFALRGVIQNYIESRIAYHQKEIEKLKQPLPVYIVVDHSE